MPLYFFFTIDANKILRETLTMKQNILKNTNGIKIIIDLLVTLLPDLEQDFLDFSEDNSILQEHLDDFEDALDHCKEIISICYSIISLFCQSNSENQK